MYLESNTHKKLVAKLSYELVKDHYGDSFGVVQRHIQNVQKINESVDIIRQLQNETYPSMSSEAYKKLYGLLTSIRL